MKRILMIIAVLIFTFSVATFGFAGEVVKGIVTKIDGDVITVKTADGKELTGKELIEKGGAQIIKVGDKVFVNHGKVSTKRIIDRH